MAVEQVNLDGRRFSPVENSAGGRVKSDAVFVFTQTGDNFAATYSGEGFSDGNLIGRMCGLNEAVLVYHCRDDSNNALEVGEAKARFTRDQSGRLEITMDWKWLNGSKASGNSRYGEI